MNAEFQQPPQAEQVEVKRGHVSTPADELPQSSRLLPLLHVFAMVVLAVVGFDLLLERVPEAWNSGPTFTIVFIASVGPVAIFLFFVPFWLLWWSRPPHPASVRREKTQGRVVGRFVQDDNGSFHPWIVVEYSSGGTNRFHAPINRRTVYSDLAGAAGELQRYPDGTTVDVYFPSDRKDLADIRPSRGPMLHLIMRTVVGVGASVTALLLLAGYQLITTAERVHGTHRQGGQRWNTIDFHPDTSLDPLLSLPPNVAAAVSLAAVGFLAVTTAITWLRYRGGAR